MVTQQSVVTEGKPAFTPRVTMRKMVSDPQLLGNVLQDDSWFGTKVLLIAAAGERLTAVERKEFTRLTNREHEPLQIVHEMFMIFGRRAGKSYGMAIFLLWIAALCTHHKLAPGEVGVALCLSRDQKVSKVILNYIDGLLRQSKLLRSLIVRRTQDTIELKNRISIEVRPCSSKTLRGPIFVCIACDEISFWYTSVDFANPDIEVLASVRPALQTTTGPLLVASSVYAKHGVLYDAYKHDYGPSGPPDILVAYGTSRDLNPSLSEASIAREIARDPLRNRAEYLSEWRDDVEGFISRELVEACVSDYVELPPLPTTSYRCFVDAASGVENGNSYAASISHRNGDLIIIDKVVEIRAPFSPSAAVADVIIPLCRTYRIHKVWGDAWAGNYPREPLQQAGIAYEVVKPNKSELYKDPFLSLLNSKRIVLPRNERAINQMCSLECSTRRSGKDEITHPIHGHDDIANAIAGAAFLVRSRYGSYDTSYSGFASDPPPGTDLNTENFKHQLLGYVNSMVATEDVLVVAVGEVAEDGREDAANTI